MSQTMRKTDGPLPPPPRCRSCGRDMDRRPRESMEHYGSRRICSMRTCTGQGLIAPDYPAAIPAHALPPQCRRCGGRWRIVEDGVRCLLCGRGQAIVEALLALAGRGVA